MKPTYLESAAMNLCQECLRITQGEPIRTPLLSQIPGERNANVARAVRVICESLTPSVWDWETVCEFCHSSPTAHVITQQASSAEASLHANTISKEIAVSLMSPLVTDQERQNLLLFIYWVNFYAVSNWVDDSLLHPQHSPEVTHPTISD